MATPVPAGRVNANLERLEKQVQKVMKAEGIAGSRQRFEFSLDVRHRGQINEVEVLLPWKRLPTGFEAALRKMFVARYEQLYGKGSALAGAQLEIVVCRLRARALTPRPKLVRARRSSAKLPAQALLRRREIYWPDLKRRRVTPIYDGERLVTGTLIRGPAIVETADTTVVVHPGRTLRLDPLGNFELTFR